MSYLWEQNMWNVAYHTLCLVLIVSRLYKIYVSRTQKLKNLYIYQKLTNDVLSIAKKTIILNGLQGGWSLCFQVTPSHLGILVPKASKKTCIKKVRICTFFLSVLEFISLEFR